MKQTLFFILLSISYFGIHAQVANTHCGSSNVHEQLLTDPAYKRFHEELEQFTANYIQQMSLGKKTRATLYKIPIVVHVIHNGEAVGSGTNISVAQINSQIAVLNKDFRLKNTDSLTPSHPFWPVTDDCEIEFCLATLGPNGLFTTGIDRFDYNQPDYDYSDIDGLIKPNTIWDRNKYLNIWVCKFGGTASTLLGYATPPGAPSDVDGVVIGTTNFGTSGNVVSPYHKGRTATHEIGHFLNLRHTWGDATCGNDFVSDTAPAEEANFGCPAYPHNANSACGSDSKGEMYMNYMDYTDDLCMKMFTTGQKNRMRATLVAGGSRSSLTTSLGCTWPVGMENLNEEATQKISLFPNPASNHFYLKSTTSFVDQIQLRVFNALGQDVTSVISFTKEDANRFYVNTSTLAAGTYFLKLTSDLQINAQTFTIIK